MNKNNISCEGMKFKIMAYIDNELTESDINTVKQHLDECPDCQKKYESLNKVKEITGEMKFKKLPEMYWEEYWSHVYNKIERGISWIFISIGTIIILTFAAWNAVTSLLNDSQMSTFLKTGIFIFIIGMVVLLVSILREKIMVKKVDKYREVER
jgi:predicted anti-sigma-YlaC factor YlaD